VKEDFSGFLFHGTCTKPYKKSEENQIKIDIYDLFCFVSYKINKQGEVMTGPI
jgi:hypothetical protein